MAVRTPSGRTFPGNFTIIPSAQKWVFHSIFRLAFISLYGEEVCSMNRLVLTDEDDAEYCSFETLIVSHDAFKSSSVMLCIFHAILQPFKKDIYLVLPEGMGVPISQAVMEIIRSQNHSSVYPRLYFGTSMEDYNEAMYVLDKKQCITEYEFHQSNEVSQNGTLFGESSIFHTSPDNMTEMICAAVNPPCLVTSPLKGSN